MPKYLPRIVTIDYRKPGAAARKIKVGRLFIIGSGLLLIVLTMLHLLG